MEYRACSSSRVTHIHDMHTAVPVPWRHTAGWLRACQFGRYDHLGPPMLEVKQRACAAGCCRHVVQIWLSAHANSEAARACP